jgi:hypothetical protein
MTRLMQQAIEQLRAVPVTQQDQLARFLLNELEEDKRWLASTAANQSKLRMHIDRVLSDDRQGKCKPLQPDRL